MTPIDPHHQAIVSSVDLEHRRRLAADHRQARSDRSRPRHAFRRAFDL